MGTAEQDKAVVQQLHGQLADARRVHAEAIRQGDTHAVLTAAGNIVQIEELLRKYRATQS